MRRRPGWPFVVAVLAGMLAGQAWAQDDDDRGRGLYEARCGGCHDRSVHRRETRIAGDYAALRAQVLRWDRALGAQWRDDEIDAVARHLNARFYRLPCPECAPRRSQGPAAAAGG